MARERVAVGGTAGEPSPSLSSALDEEGLPSGTDFSRGAGSWATQIATAKHGTTFWESGTSENTPRFHYFANLGRRALLIEPARTNIVPAAWILDATADGQPDGWDVAAGNPTVDFRTVTGGPSGGRFFELMATGIARGVSDSVAMSAATYRASCYVRRPTTNGIAATVRTIFDGVGVAPATFTIVPGQRDWYRVQVNVVVQIAAGNVIYMYSQGFPNSEILQFWGWQLELAAACASTPIPTTAGALSRARESLEIDGDVISEEGVVQFLWMPMYSSTEPSGSVRLFHFGTGSRIEYDGSDDRVKVYNEDDAKALSAELTFDRETPHLVRLEYGAVGTRLTVDGVSTLDSDEWVAPTPEVFLGSGPAGEDMQPSGYADLFIAEAA